MNKDNENNENEEINSNNNEEINSEKEEVNEEYIGRRLIDAETGEIYDNVRTILFNQHKKAEYINSTQGNNFIFLTYKLCKKLNIDKEKLTQSEIVRVIMLSTYINYDGKLMATQRVPMTKEKLANILKIDSPRNFDNFYKKLLSLDIIYEKEDSIWANEKLMFKGKINTSKFSRNCDEVMKVYIKEVRRLYAQFSIREHKKLSVLFMLIPFLNKKYNVACHNPFEENEDEVIPITIGELADAFEYTDKKYFYRLIKSLGTLVDGNGETVIKMIMDMKNGDLGNIIIVNPRVVYSGRSYADVKSLVILFNKTKI